jgi:hypothetical protein
MRQPRGNASSFIGRFHAADKRPDDVALDRRPSGQAFAKDANIEVSDCIDHVAVNAGTDRPFPSLFGKRADQLPPAWAAFNLE